MFSTYLKIALRILLKKKTNSFLSIIGLSIGLTAGFLIFQYIAYERSFDTFNENHEQIYRIALNSYQSGELTERSATSYPALGPSAKQFIPEVHDYTRIYKQPGVIKYGEHKFHEQNGYLADASAITTFAIKIVQGDKEALKNPNSIIISDAISRKYFGNTNSLNKTITFENELYVVRAIFQDYPKNAHVKIDYLLSYPDNELMQQSWRWRNFYTYLSIKPGSNIPSLQQKLEQLMIRNNSGFYEKENRQDEVLLQPLKSIHLHSHLDKELDVNGSATSLIFLFIVGILVIVISWVNYINLMVASASTRLKEIGVRKVLGSSNKQLIKQFFNESLLLNGMAFSVAVVAIMLISPWFTRFSGTLSLNHIWTYREFVLLVIIILLTGLTITGLIPSVLMSRLKSVSLIKGMITFTRQPFSLRGALIALQFFLTTALITGVLVIYRQLNFMTSKHPGYITEQIVVFKGFGGNDSLHSPQGFINEISNAPYINRISTSAFVPGQEISRIRGIKRKETGKPAYHTFANTTIDYNFIDLYEMKLMAGRNFSKYYPSDNKAVLLNEEAARILGFRNAAEAINKEIINGDRNPDTLTVAGVLENFHQRSVQFAISPIVFLLGNDKSGYYSIRLNTGDVNTAMDFIEKTHRKYLGNHPFEFFFLDDHFRIQYQKDRQFATLFSIFTAIAICISCLGLFAMIQFIAEQRTREIGIRKVLGASVINIFSMLTKDLLKPIIIAILIATPVTWWLMNGWLQNYASRIRLSGDLFVFGAVVVIMIAMLTISSQVIKAAVMNPVKSLRME